MHFKNSRNLKTPRPNGSVSSVEKLSTKSIFSTCILKTAILITSERYALSLAEFVHIFHAYLPVKTYDEECINIPVNFANSTFVAVMASLNVYVPRLICNS